VAVSVHSYAPQLLSTAKCPLLFTANDAAVLSAELSDPRVLRLTLNPPSLPDCLLHLLLVCLCEGTLHPSPVLAQYLSQYLSSVQCDLRRSLLNLQLHSPTNPLLPSSHSSLLESTLGLERFVCICPLPALLLHHSHLSFEEKDALCEMLSSTDVLYENYLALVSSLSPAEQDLSPTLRAAAASGLYELSLMCDLLSACDVMESAIAQAETRRIEEVAQPSVREDDNPVHSPYRNFALRYTSPPPSIPVTLLASTISHTHTPKFRVTNVRRTAATVTVAEAIRAPLAPPATSRVLCSHFLFLSTAADRAAAEVCHCRYSGSWHVACCASLSAPIDFRARTLFASRALPGSTSRTCSASPQLYHSLSLCSASLFLLSCPGRSQSECSAAFSPLHAVPATEFGPEEGLRCVSLPRCTTAATGPFAFVHLSNSSQLSFFKADPVQDLVDEDESPSPEERTSKTSDACERQMPAQGAAK
jgi:hypothetical protein